MKGLPGPGKDATRQAEAATTAIHRLAAASGHVLAASGGGGSSAARDRLTIAAGVTALVALLAAIGFLRKKRPAAGD